LRALLGGSWAGFLGPMDEGTAEEMYERRERGSKNK